MRKTHYAFETDLRVTRNHLLEGLQANRTELESLQATLEATKTELKADLSETKADLSETKTNLQTTRTELTEERALHETTRTQLQDVLRKFEKLEMRTAYLESALIS